MTILGIISLAGIVVNNAIILLDRIKIEIDVNGLNPPDAIIQAAQRCLRPILITTATTIAGLMPLCLLYIIKAPISQERMMYDKENQKVIYNSKHGMIIYEPLDWSCPRC